MLTQGTRVLITGGAGFIGSHLARALSALRCEVRVLDDLSTGKRERIAALDGVEFLQGDVRNPAAVHRAMQGVHAVVHLAGVQPGVDPIRAQDVNLGGALHILNFAREVEKLERLRVVLCGSASVYGRQTGFVLHEELQPRPATPEAVMSLAMEQYGRVYRETYGVLVVNLRIFRVFGPDEDAERPDAGIVAKLVRAALDGKAPIIFGDGQQTRDLIYVDNVVAAILAALEVKDPPAEPLNIASGEAVAINFLWNLVLETCGKRRLTIDPTYVPAPPWDPKHTRPQIARACKVLGWAPAVRLREALAKTVEHYQALRNADPNAWFAPKEEPAARQKMTFPTVQVPTRRFGSVVTPAFGVPVVGSSSATPLPRANGGNGANGAHHYGANGTSQPRSSSATTPLPRANSTATPLPRASSTATPLPQRNGGSVAGPPPIPPPRKSTSAAPPARAPLAPMREEVLEVSDADLVEDNPCDDETQLEDGLNFEWAPVPAVPGLGR
jgi:nucleoside-diphosphate-sugar epimerase